jgi:predicted phage terminase large subunit-like protein
LTKTKLAVGSYEWNALYQQRPRPLEGGMFQRPWFSIIPAAPIEATRVRYWDKAGTAGDGDYSAGVLMGKRPDGRFFIEDVLRGQWSSGQREAVMKQTAQLDNAKYGHVAIWHEQEPGSGGKDSAAATTRNLTGFAVYSERVTGDKLTRAQPFAAQCEAGNVDLVAGAWNAAYLDELTTFPNGAHDDQVDGSSGAFGKLAQRGARLV